MPNPGSDQAIAEGCKCPVLDNRHGHGIPSSDGTLFYYASNCPLHATGDFPGGREPMEPAHDQ